VRRAFSRVDHLLYHRQSCPAGHCKRAQSVLGCFVATLMLRKERVHRFNTGDAVLILQRFAHLYPNDFGVIVAVKIDPYRSAFNEYVVKCPTVKSQSFLNFSLSKKVQPCYTKNSKLSGRTLPSSRRRVDATSRKYREASFEERPAGGARASPIGRSHQEKTSLTSYISECVLNTACERPPRLRRFGGFATSS